MIQDKCKEFLKFIRQSERLKSVPTEHYTPVEYTQSDFRNDVNNENDIKRIIGRKYQYFLKNAYKFLNTFKFIAQRKKIISFPIATHSKYLCSLYGSVCNVSNFISSLIDIDLLKCVDTKYHFNESIRSKNYCRQYILNKKVQDLLLSLFKKYNLRKPVTKQVNIFETEEDEIIEEIHKGIPLSEYKVKFGRQNTNVNYESIDDIVNYIENEGTDFLVHDYQEKVKLINETYFKDNETEKIHFNIKVKTNKAGRISNISTRAFSYLCFYKSHLERCKNKSGLILKDYLDEKYKDGYLHYDSKASVYKVNYALNHNGEWLDNDVDLYELLYGNEFDSKDSRDSFKNLMMYIQFVKSIKQIKHFLLNKYSDLKLYYTNKELENIIIYLKNNYRNIIGDSLYSKVFLYESCIYIDLFNELSSLGFNVSMIYDSFYIENNNNIINNNQFTLLCNKLLSNIVKRFYYRYIYKDIYNNSYRIQYNSNRNQCNNSSIIICNIQEKTISKDVLIKDLKEINSRVKFKDKIDNNFEFMLYNLNSEIVRKEKLMTKDKHDDIEFGFSDGINIDNLFKPKDYEPIPPEELEKIMTPRPKNIIEAMGRIDKYRNEKTKLHNE